MPVRSVETSIWSDERFTELPPDAQLVYFRFITGEDTGPAGATRALAKRIAVDTNLSLRRAQAALEALVASGLVRRYDDWLWLGPAWIKHQVHGPQFIRAVRRQAKECPDALRIAIGRALDTHCPPTKPDESRTEKSRMSSMNGDGHPTVTRPSHDPHPTLRGEGKDQDYPSFGGDSPSGTGSAPPRGGPASPEPTRPQLKSIEAARALAESQPEGSVFREAFERGMETSRRLKALEG